MLKILTFFLFVGNHFMGLFNGIFHVLLLFMYPAKSKEQLCKIHFEHHCILGAWLENFFGSITLTLGVDPRSQGLIPRRFKRKKIFGTNGRTDARTDGRTDVSVKIVI